MHLRKLVLACGFASFVLSNYASALGLGEVKLKSTLNQPLSAEVQLLDTKGLSPEQIIVSLGTVNDFERNGLDFVHFYTEFQFEVALDNPGGPVVRITSRNPVREPYLNFLIEAKWTSGRLLREYTVLMDLPTFDDKAPAAVQAAQTAPSTSSSTNRKSTATAQPSAPSNALPEEKPPIIAEQDQTAKKSKTAAGTYGPVGGKDTLWDIALAVRPDSNASVHQTMLALQRLNPDAFIHGNINLLKKGQVLRVPESSEISSISQSEAVRQFNTQTAEWSGGAGANAGLGAPLDASRRSTGTQTKSEAVAGRVKLEAPSSKDKSGSGQGSGANKGSGKALESELATTLEELEKSKSEKTELSSRVRDLEDQVKTMQRLVDVSNEKLRALQLNSTKQPEKGAEKSTAPAIVPVPVPSTPEAASAPVETKTPAEIAATASSAQATSSVAAVVAPSSTAAAVPKKTVPPKVVTSAPQQKSIVDQLFDNILWVGLGLLALLIAAFVVITRRRKAEAEEALARENSDALFAPEPNFDAFNQTHAEESEADAVAEEPDLFEEDSTAVAETGDVVGEADIYIAYGKFDQAEEMLLNGLAKDPQSTEIRLKLLEVYSQTENLSAFDKHYSAILPLATGFALARASELRSNIPGAGEFVAEDTAATENDSLDLNEELGFNEEFALDDDLETLPSVETAHTADDDLSFDLDLDDDIDLNSSATNYGMDFTDTNSSSTAVATDTDDDFLLDFDLDETAHSEATPEDLSEISLALDGLDDDDLPVDVNVPRSETLLSEDDEFNFDFDDIDTEPSALAEEVDSIKSAEFNNEDDALADDFNLELDVSDHDLQALDDEISGLDAELDKLDDESFAAPVANEVTSLSEEYKPEAFETTEFEPEDLEPESVQLGEFGPGEFEPNQFETNEYEIGSLDDDISDLDENLTYEELESLGDLDADTAELEEESLEAELDDSELSWDESEELVSEPELSHEFSSEELLSEELLSEESEEALSEELLAEELEAEELGVDDNDEFDIDAPVALADNVDLHELDEDDLSGSIADKENVDDESSINIDDLSFAELDELNAAHGPETSDSIAAEEFAFDELEPSHSSSIEDELDVADDEQAIDDDLFEQALSDFSAEGLALDNDSDVSEDDLDAELDFMADADEAATKLDLARAYIDMGDSEGARDILAEVASEGNDQQRQEAIDLLGRIDA